jgi:hypothetical protein
MTSTALERAPTNGTTALFPGTTAAEILDVARDAATRFADVVEKQHMKRRIGSSDHIQIEAWQTIGAFTGVAAVKDEITRLRGGVEQLPWPELAQLGPEPPVPEREPTNRDSPQHREWELADELRAEWEILRRLHAQRALGRAFGFRTSFDAVKNGTELGWGEGSVDRTELQWAPKPDHELRSMAQTRAQSRALSVPLKWTVKLAGYETTPAEEFDGDAPAGAAAGPPPPPWGKTVDDDKQLDAAAEVVKAIAPEIDGAKFIVDMGAYFDGVPEANLKLLRALWRRIDEARTPADEPVTDAEVVP